MFIRNLAKSAKERKSVKAKEIVDRTLGAVLKIHNSVYCELKVVSKSIDSVTGLLDVIKTASQDEDVKAKFTTMVENMIQDLANRINEFADVEDFIRSKPEYKELIEKMDVSFNEFFKAMCELDERDGSKNSEE